MICLHANKKKLIESAFVRQHFWTITSRKDFEGISLKDADLGKTLFFFLILMNAHLYQRPIVINDVTVTVKNNVKN